MFWDIEDEQICKRICKSFEAPKIFASEQVCKSILADNDDIIELKEKYGQYCVDKTVKYYSDLGYSINDTFDVYKNMPNLHIITNIFDNQRYEIIKAKLNLNTENKLGFCFETLFGLNKNKTKFKFSTEVKTILRYI